VADPQPAYVDIPRRVENAERYIDEQRKFNAQLTEGLWALRVALEKGVVTMDAALEAMSARVKVHDERRGFWIKVWLAVVTAGAVGLLGWLMRISWMVQSSKLP